MMSQQDFEAIERAHWNAVISASDTGGMSVAEVADLTARNCSRLLAELKTMRQERVALYGALHGRRQQHGQQLQISYA